jgi:SAM-dependent methyltransferase
MARRDAMTPAPTNLHYFTADAENIPIRAGVADITIFSGILHHVAHPQRVIAEAVRTLRPGGRFIGMENNRTVFRPIFDLLMRLKKLWNEKAHPEHFLISGAELERWFADAGVKGSIWTSVFVPPHAFNALPVTWASRVLKLTDMAAQALPWVRDQGGLILFTGEKEA